MTITQILAILSILWAFGVDQPTINKVHDILIPPIVDTSPVSLGTVNQQPQSIPTTQPTQPTQTVNNSPTTPTPVVVLPSMEAIVVRDTRTYPPTESDPYGHLVISVSVLDADGKDSFLAPVKMEAPDNRGGVQNNETNTESGTNKNDWVAYFSYYPTTSGDKVITFTSGNLSTTYQFKQIQ